MLRKFMFTVAAGSLFVGGLAATHLAYAQPGPEGGPRGRGGIMALADADKDGKISKAEMTAAAEARFTRMDVDKDGQITPKDRDLKRAERLDTRFAALDTDHNGQISKAEFAAGHQARADKRAERGGPDGKRWGGRRHRGPDGFGPMGGAGKDGTVTRAQFLASATERFDRLDANKDGFVNPDEMKAARQAMRAQWRARQASQD